MRAYRHNVSAEVWLDEVNRLSADSQRLLPAGDLSDALAQLQFIDEQCVPDRSVKGATLAFLTRSVERQSQASWRDASVGPIYRKLRKLTHPELDPKDAPGMDPAEEPSGSLSRVHVRQWGDQFTLQTSGGESEQPEGSYLLTCSSTNQLVVLAAESQPNVARDMVAAFWKSGVKPNWATAFGTDAFGPWAEVEVASPEADIPVRQRLRWIPPGSFQMGSPQDEPGRYESEGPIHPVTITRGFWLFDVPCTQALWSVLMRENPSRFQDPGRPVEQVSWHDCQRFLGKLGEHIQAPDSLRLPTEAEWEYAGRAGTTTALYSGEIEILGENNAPALDAIAWYGGNSGVDFDLPDGQDSTGWKEKQFHHEKAGTRRVGKKRPNAWGLYDMLGNVWEWCQDDLRDYDDSAQQDPVGALDGAERVLRGGSWIDDARSVRAASRFAFVPSDRNAYIGFRCALVQAGAEPVTRSPGSQAERRLDDAEQGDARVALRVDTDLRFDLSSSRNLHVITDLEQWDVDQVSPPSWAVAMGRDPYGLWADFQLEVPNIGDPVRQRLRWIPPGRFRMGSDSPEDSLVVNASPSHMVTISTGFWLFDTPVTQQLWAAVVGNNPSNFSGPQRPVEQVSWNDCASFLSQIADRLPGARLPTEAQWEYACRAGTATAYSFGSEISKDLARFESDATIDVGSFPCNSWGLFDMHGNVWEWCRDSPRGYDKASKVDPVGAADGAERVLRGGGWFSNARNVRAACRYAYGPSDRDDSIGFRCALVPEPDEPLSTEETRDCTS